MAAQGEWLAKEAGGGKGNIFAFLVLSNFGILFCLVHRQVYRKRSAADYNPNSN